MRNEYGLPDPGSNDWEDMVDFMRQDLESGMGYTKLIDTTKEILKEQGRDFDEEFEKWKKRNK